LKIPLGDAIFVTIAPPKTAASSRARQTVCAGSAASAIRGTPSRASDVALVQQRPRVGETFFIWRSIFCHDGVEASYRRAPVRPQGRVASLRFASVVRSRSTSAGIWPAPLATASVTAALSGMFPIGMFRAAESGTLHPEQRAPIGRTRMIRGAPYQSSRHRFSGCPQSSETPRLSCEPESRACYRRRPRTPMPGG
jgi:hypothetical protein